MARPRPAPTLLDGGWEGVTQRASRPVMSEMGRCCRKRVLRKTTAQYRFKIKRRYAILIQRKEYPDSIISKFNSTVLSWILFRQHRPEPDLFGRSVNCSNEIAKECWRAPEAGMAHPTKASAQTR